MSTSLHDLTNYLDQYLQIDAVQDVPNALNGLQVENSGSVSLIGAAVDACQATIDAAARHDVSLLLVHHGLFWGGNQPVTGRHWRRIRALITHDIALYSAHIPLDCHPAVGNNAILARELGLTETQPFGDHLGTAIGIAGNLQISRNDLVGRLEKVLGARPHVIPAGPDDVKSVGVITGGGGSMIDQAKRFGIDTYITGEGSHHTHFDAEEWGINVVYGGHYATETFGVKALAQHIQDRLGLAWEFLDHPTQL